MMTSEEWIEENFRLRQENGRLQEEVKQLRKEVEMWKTLAMPDSEREWKRPYLEAENERLRAQDARMRSALAAIANYFELSLGFREGDKEYQAVILARDALK